MIEYRKATIDDLEPFTKIRVDFLSEMNNGFGENEKEIIYKNNKQYFSDSLTDGSFAAWVAVNNEEIIATSGISFCIFPPNIKCPTGKSAYISNMFTYPQYRNQGVATKLFYFMVEEAKDHGCGKILLNATDMGRSIYEKFGFKDIGNDMVYYISI